MRGRRRIAMAASRSVRTLSPPGPAQWRRRRSSTTRHGGRRSRGPVGADPAASLRSVFRYGPDEERWPKRWTGNRTRSRSGVVPAGYGDRSSTVHVRPMTEALAAAGWTTVTRNTAHTGQPDIAADESGGRPRCRGEAGPRRRPVVSSGTRRRHLAPRPRPSNPARAVGVRRSLGATCSGAGTRLDGDPCPPSWATTPRRVPDWTRSVPTLEGVVRSARRQLTSQAR